MCEEGTSTDLSSENSQFAGGCVVSCCEGLVQCSWSTIDTLEDIVYLHLCWVFFSCCACLSGLGSLFSGPDLSGISEQPLRVSSVRHATTMELSEEGVEASATTVVTAMRSISLFSVNSPFLFALVDDFSLAPLFMGIVTNPAPDNDPMPNDDPNGNNTMNDQPGTEAARETDLNVELNRLPAEGSTLQSCSSPGGGKEQLQQVDEQDGSSSKTEGGEPCSKPEILVPVWKKS